MERVVVYEVEQKWLTAKQACRYLGGISVGTLRGWRDTAKLRHYIVGGKTFYKVGDLDKFMEKHRII